MTTIAWDGKTLAGDSFADRGGMKHPVDTKVWRLADGRLYGGSGNWADVISVRDWLNGGEKPSGISDYSGLVIERDGSCGILGERLVSHPSPFPYFAIGSGRDYAITAMRLGRGAREAVEIAGEFDTYTLGPFTEVAL